MKTESKRNYDSSLGVVAQLEEPPTFNRHDADSNSAGPTKICCLCHENKALGEFNRNSGRRDGYQSHCRSCSHVRFKRYYNGNKPHHKAVVTARKVGVIQLTRERLFMYLVEHPCVDCGEKDPVVLDLDHVRGTKRKGVTQLVAGGASWKTIEAEIAKCEVRCANCHRRKTAREGGHFRHRRNGQIDRRGS